MRVKRVHAPYRECVPGTSRRLLRPRAITSPFAYYNVRVQVLETGIPREIPPLVASGLAECVSAGCGVCTRRDRPCSLISGAFDEKIRAGFCDGNLDLLVWRLNSFCINGKIVWSSPLGRQVRYPCAPLKLDCFERHKVTWMTRKLHTLGSFQVT